MSLDGPTGVRSGDRGGHKTGPIRPARASGRVRELLYVASKTHRISITYKTTQFSAIPMAPSQVVEVIHMLPYLANRAVVTCLLGTLRVI